MTPGFLWISSNCSEMLQGKSGLEVGMKIAKADLWSIEGTSLTGNVKKNVDLGVAKRFLKLPD